MSEVPALPAAEPTGGRSTANTTVIRLVLAVVIGVLGISLAGHGPLASAIHDPLFGSSKVKPAKSAGKAFPPGFQVALSLRTTINQKLLDVSTNPDGVATSAATCVRKNGWAYTCVVEFTDGSSAAYTTTIDPNTGGFVYVPA